MKLIGIGKMDELVDVVDVSDIVIRQELKSKCHELMILHRGAAVLCFKDARLDEILITKRSPKKRSHPNLLCLPGGHVGAGESYLDGAKREFIEEVAMDTNKTIELEPLFKIKKRTDNDPEIQTIYKTIYDGPFKIDPQEVSESYFMKINDLLKDIKSSPEKYIETCVLVLTEYEKRYLCQK